MNKAKKRKQYFITAIILILLIVTAYLIPQFYFATQDKKRFRVTELENREVFDITALGVPYEQSMYERLSRYAREIQEGKTFYITKQEQTPDAAFYDVLNSEWGLYQDNILFLVDYGILPASFIFEFDWSEGFFVAEWDQYVVYTENFSDGVNFIFWYMELQSVDGGILKILVDAETKEMYAVQADYTKSEKKTKYEKEKETLDSLSDENVAEVGNYFYSQYGEDITVQEKERAGEEKLSLAAGAETSMAADKYSYQSNAEAEEIENGYSQVIYDSEDGKTQIDYQYQYGDSKLTFRLENTTETETNLYDRDTAGFLDIYRMIPGFSE